MEKEFATVEELSSIFRSKSELYKIMRVSSNTSLSNTASAVQDAELQGHAGRIPPLVHGRR